MLNPSATATIASLSLLLAVSPLTAQLAAQADHSKRIDALQRVQAALHAAENAQLALIRAPAHSPARRAVDRAVAELITARQALRDQLAKRPVRQPGAEPRLAKQARQRDAKPPRPNPQQVEDAIQKGLKWLGAHQDQNGRWDSDGFSKHDLKGRATDGAGNPVHDVGATGLALLAFLGAGNTTKSGPYKDVVAKAATWLVRQQGANGMFGVNASHDFIYDHSIAALAMCEAFGLSQDQRLRAAAQKGINYLESHRNPYSCWRYQPRDNDNDSSVTGWCLKAYRSAADFDLQVNRQAMKIISNYLDELTDPSNGKLGYTKRGESSSRHPGDHSRRFPIEKGDALTALGLSSRFSLGQSPAKTPVMRLAAQRLLQRPPTAADQSSVDHYYWFHGTQGMWRMGGEYWDRWSRAVGKAILGTQRQDQAFVGSWDSAGVWGEDGGRIYATALMVLSLQALGRYRSLLRDERK